MAKGRKQKNFSGTANSQEEQRFKQKLIDLRRVSRTVAGGKRLRFRATMVIGDANGQIGFGVAKGIDVAGAIAKAVVQAQKNIIKIPIVNETIPSEIRAKYKAVEVLIKPVRIGHGLVAGGPVRVALNLGGVKNATGKIIRGKNKVNVIKAVFKALEKLV